MHLTTTHPPTTTPHIHEPYDRSLLPLTPLSACCPSLPRSSPHLLLLLEVGQVLDELGLHAAVGHGPHVLLGQQHVLLSLRTLRRLQSRLRLLRKQ